MNLPPVETIDCRELHERSQQGAVEIIDVRSPEEFAEGRAAGARNVPLDGLDPHAVAGSRRDPEERLYFICKMGGRSEMACLMLMAAGYRNVVNVEGGTLAWAEASLPVERG